MTLSICYQNVRGLNTKTSEFSRNVLLSSEFDIFVCTESWLGDNVSSHELFGSDYAVFRYDRCESGDMRRGGGVIVAVKLKSVLSVSQVQTRGFSSSLEALCLKLTFANKTLFLLAVYIQPNNSSIVYDGIFDSFYSMPFLYDNNFLIIGDANLASLSSYYTCKHSDRIIDVLLSFEAFFNASQVNRVTNDHGRILDVVLCSEGIASEVTRHPFPLVREDSHHPTLNISVNIDLPNVTNLQCSGESVYNFSRADFMNMYHLLRNAPWDSLSEYRDVNAAFDEFYRIITDVFNITVPKTIRRSGNYPPWFTYDIIKNLKIKSRYHKLWKNYALTCYYKKFSNVRAKLKSDMKLAYKNYIATAECNIRNDPKQIWSFVNSRKNASKLPASIKYNEKIVSGGADISNAFADYFQSVFLPGDAMNFDFLPAAVGYDNDMVFLRDISERDVLDAIDKLKPKRSVGPDFIPSYVLKGCKEIFVKPLTLLFNLSLSSRCFPDALKLSRGCPVFKSGDRSDIENYRLITINSNISKVYELIIFKYIMSSVKDNISIHQHGFVKGRSTTSNLLNFVQFTLDSFSNESQVDVVYTDATKAFDRISHNIILYKLKYIHNFSPHLIELMASYLSNRFQSVCVNNFTSVRFRVTSGVPQGSILGPLLFILFINDVVDVVRHSQVLLYADDIKVFRPIDTVDDCVKLQQDVDEIVKWATKSELQFNIMKCKAMSFSRKKDTIMFAYNIDGSALQRVDNFCDLGVYMDTKLAFSGHIGRIVREASRMAGFIIRNCRGFSDIGTLKILYNSLVRSRLEYCCVVWNPLYNCYILQLENVQKRFLRCSKSIVEHRFIDDCYSNLLVDFKLPTLKNRRLMCELLYLYKLVHNMIDDIEFRNCLSFAVPDLRTRQSATFYVPCLRTNYGRNSPLFSMCLSYNQLSCVSDIFGDSYYVFKRLFRSHFSP